MSEITLTGGTLVPDSAATTNAADAATAGYSSHSHSHGHGAHCQHNHNHGHAAASSSIEMIATAPSMDDLANASPEEITRTLSTLLRFGRFEALQPLLEKLDMSQVLQQPDDGGHSLFHWAAKRVDDIRFLSTLIDMANSQYTASSSSSSSTKTPQQLFNMASNDSVGMRPLHWACTEGSIPHAALLLKHGADLEAKDNSGCTPLLIAAQYGQVEVVAYLLKKGANIQAVDTSWDSALHWAAYKGSIHVCGLLAYHQELSFATQDAYGQTPLHLAALRGHTSVVRYILQRLDRKDVLFLKDKNERTPLDLAIHKNRPTVEAVLKEAMAKVEDPRGHFFRKTLWTNLKDMCSPKTWKLWMGFTAGMDEMDEPTRFPYYFVIFTYAVHLFFMLVVFAPFFKPETGMLWDKSGWLLINFVFMFLSWFFFYKTVTTKPGYLDDSLPDIAKWRRLYEETLESLADEHAHEKNAMQLCHTCHVARPHRAKHCRVQRKCVLLFDHFCPFVDNTVGLYNYRYFYLFLLFMTLGVASFAITLGMYLSRYHKEHGSMNWMLLVFGLEVCLTGLPLGGMCIYHTQLSMVNLSTNEHLNVRRYKYLYPVVNGKRQYKNPWFKGFWGNFMDRMNPSPACYEISLEHESLVSGVIGAHSSSSSTKRSETV